MELGIDFDEKFEKLAKEHFGPRSDKQFAKELKDRLAVDPNGNHIAGAIGAALLDHYLAQNWFESRPASRQLTLTRRGEAAVRVYKLSRAAARRAR